MLQKDFADYSNKQRSKAQEDILSGKAALDLLDRSLLKVRHSCMCGKGFDCVCGCSYPLHNQDCVCDSCLRKVEHKFEELSDVNVYHYLQSQQIGPTVKNDKIDVYQTTQAEVASLLQEFPFLQQYAEVNVQDKLREEAIEIHVPGHEESIHELKQKLVRGRDDPEYLNTQMFDVSTSEANDYDEVR